MNPSARTAVPTPVTVARVLLALVALSHLVVPGVMLAAPGIIAAQIAAGHPEFSGATVTAATDIALRSAVVFHAVLFVLTAFVAFLLRTGAPWVRWLTTVSQLLAVAFSAVSWQSSPQFHAVIPVVGLAQIAAVVLIWLPSTRGFFASTARS